MSAQATLAATPSVARVAGLPHARWTTPWILRLFVTLVVALAALVALVGWRAVVRARDAIETVGRQTAPAIIAAQEVSAALADLDANAASFLLLSEPSARDQAAQLYEYRRAEATKRLVEAAGGNAVSERARTAIVLVYENLGRYDEAVSSARLALEHGDAAGALDAYRVATDIMHARMLVDAQSLDQVNADVMKQEYDAQQTASQRMETGAVLSGVLLVAVLIAAQAFLLRRTRRLLNPALLIATVVAFGYTGDLYRRIGDAREDLRVAKEDAFDSIHALWQARAWAYDANGDQYRALLDVSHGDSWQASFKTSVAALTTAPSIPPSAQREIDGGGKVSFGGVFAKELDNITFVGERDAAVAMVKAFSDYYAKSVQVEGLEQKGKHADAIQLALGPSREAFAIFDATALRTLNINQRVFDAVIADAEGALASVTRLDPLLALLVALGAWLGIRPRLREYAS